MPYVLVKGQKNTYLLSEQVFFFFFLNGKQAGQSAKSTKNFKQTQVYNSTNLYGH